MPPFLRFCQFGVLLCVVSACNGGSDSNTTSPTRPEITPGGSGTLGSWYIRDFTPWESFAASLRQSARYRLQNSSWSFGSGSPQYQSAPLTAAHIEYAHAVGLTGLGAVIAISDAGFRINHEAFGNRVDQVTGAVVPDDHGTMVASIAAGDSPMMIGVAPKATLILGSYDSSVTLTQTAIAARAAGAVALNNSWGYTLAAATPTGFNDIFQDSDGAAYLDALKAYAAEGVVVFALSNDHALTESDLMPALPLLVPELESGWLAVGNATAEFNTDHVTAATRISAACLEAAAWCLVADGTWTAASAYDPTTGFSSTTSYDFGTGSSFAAPQVSGALALLAEAFPDLTPHQLRLRLLASADNSFAGFTADGSIELAPGFWHDYSTEFGHGFLNLKSALMPIGTPTVTMAEGAVPVEQATVHTGAGLGDAVSRGLGVYSLAVADSFAGQFALPAPALAAEAAPEPLSMRAARIGAAGIASSGAEIGGSIAGFDGFSGADLAMISPETGMALHLLAPQAGSESLGLSLVRRFGDDRAALDLGLKLARDGGEVFGLGSGANGSGTTAAALTVGLRGSLGGDGFVQMGAEFGLANADGSGALNDVGQMSFNSFGAEVGQHNVFSSGDRLTVGISAPIAVTAGTARTEIALRRPGDGKARMAAIAVPLSPEAREIDVRISYDLPISDSTALRLDLIHANDFGNRQDETDSAAALTLRITF